MVKFNDFMSFVRGAVVASAAVIATAGGAAAATMGVIPGGGTNEGLTPIYGSATPVSGWFGANLGVVGSNGTATVTADYHGAEAFFDNSFTLGGSPAINTGGSTNSFSLVPFATQQITGVGNGLLSFLFDYDSGAGSVANGANPNGSGPSSPPNFFVTFKPSTGENAVLGTIVDLWLDDGGAGPDDNHDDMMIRLTIRGGSFGIVPVPASVPLLLTAFAGFGVISRRKNRKS